VSSLALCNAATGTRFSRCVAENIYVSGELSSSNQSLITIQRTHMKIKTTSTPSRSEGIELKHKVSNPFTTTCLI